MRLPAVLAGLLTTMTIQTTTVWAQTCNVQGPPYGPTRYVGNAGYTFDYWSHAGNVKGENFYQPGTKNLGQTPLTIDWHDADYFRRGIAPGKAAPGTCDSDHNPLNTAYGVIKYGPNANFDGPTAPFYTRPSHQASRSSGRIDFVVEWEAILDSGEKYVAAVSVGAAPSGANSIQYHFTSKGRPVELEWPDVLTTATLAVAQRQSDRLVRAGRLVLNTSDTVFLTATADGQNIGVITSPLSIFIPNGLLLYRDKHRGLAFFPRTAAQ